MSIKYRILQAEEWYKLKTLVDPTYIPNVNSAVASVAEDSDTGELLGVQFLQLAMHCEPLVLKSSQVRFDRLHQLLIDSIAEKPENKGLVVYAFASSQQVCKMAEINGMKYLPYSVYTQEV